MDFFDFDKANRVNLQTDFFSHNHQRGNQNNATAHQNERNNSQGNQNASTQSAYANNAQGNISQSDVMQKFMQYSNKSESELYGELVNTVQRMKKEGTFDMAQLNAFFNIASPYLNDEQRQNMKQLIDTIGHQL